MLGLHSGCDRCHVSLTPVRDRRPDARSYVVDLQCLAQQQPLEVWMARNVLWNTMSGGRT